MGNDVEKEEETPKAKKSKFKSPKQTVIDVEALFKSGDKNSVTNKTLAAMTTEQQTAIIKEAIVDTLNDNNEQSFCSLDKI